MMTKKWAVFFISAACFIFQYILVRTFSVTLWYHFSQLVLSFAFLGIFLGSLCFACLRSPYFSDRRLSYCALAGAFFSLAGYFFHLHFDLSDVSLASSPWLLISIIVLETVFLIGTFFFGSLVLTALAFNESERFARIYGFDLLGAGFGLLLGYFVSDYLKIPQMIWFVFLFFWMGFFLLAKPRRKGFFLLAGLVAIGTAAYLSDGVFSIRHVKSFDWNRLQTSESPDSHEIWGRNSRVTVAPAAKQTWMVLNDAGAPTYLHQMRSLEDVDEKMKQRLMNSPVWLAFQLRPKAEALIIGAGGGIDVMAALFSQAQRIDAVELNPITYRLTEKTYAKEMGDIFHQPSVHHYLSEGRRFVERSDRRYDVIQISMIDSWINGFGGNYVFNENYLYTVQAVKSYARHLKDDGVLSITRYRGFMEGPRLVNLVQSVAEELNLPTHSVAAVISYNRKLRMHLLTVLMKKGGFTESETRLIESAGHMKRGGRTEKADNRDYDLRPSTDDRPFFFFTEKFSQIFHPRPLRAHPSRRLAMPILTGTIGGLLMLLAFVYLLAQRKLRTQKLPGFSLLLGIGYSMFQFLGLQTTVPLTSHPSESFALSLTIFLFAGGIGSSFSDKIAQKFQMPVLALSAVSLAFYGLFRADLFHWLYGGGLFSLFVLAIFLIVSVGIGLWFPLFFQNLPHLSAQKRAWLFALNGLACVCGSNLAMLLSIYLGFQISILISAAFYGLAWLVLLMKRQNFAFR